jgi:hypothetical protein
MPQACEGYRKKRTNFKRVTRRAFSTPPENLLLLRNTAKLVGATVRKTRNTAHAIVYRLCVYTPVHYFALFCTRERILVQKSRF